MVGKYPVIAPCGNTRFKEQSLEAKKTALDLARIREFIATHEWHFAKTMPEIPHWYCLRKDKGDIEEFTWFARTIREHSVPGQFYGKAYHYFYLDGYKYWRMDPTAEECDLINRDKI